MMETSPGPRPWHTFRRSLANARSSARGAVAGMLVMLARSAAAQGAHPEREMAAALENTSKRIDVVRDELSQLGEQALDVLPLLAVAAIAIAAFWVVARLLTAGDWLFRWIQNRFVRDMVRHFSRIAIVGIGIVLALELLSATKLVGAALGAAGVLGIAIGFAFRDIIENFLAGLLLGMRRPFEPNDLISIDGEEGKVVRLTSRATVLLTLAGNHLRIPNARVFKAVLLNYTRNPLRRLDFEVNVGVSEDLAEAQRLGVAALSSLDAILAEPPPLALIEGLGDSSVPIHLYAWLDQRETDYFKARSEAIRVLKSAYDDAKIEMPEPIYQVYVREHAKSPAQQVERPSSESSEQGDTTADVRLDEQVESERAAEGPDLLDEEAPRE